MIFKSSASGGGLLERAGYKVYEPHHLEEGVTMDSFLLTSVFPMVFLTPASVANLVSLYIQYSMGDRIKLYSLMFYDYAQDINETQNVSVRLKVAVGRIQCPTHTYMYLYPKMS